MRIYLKLALLLLLAWPASATQTLVQHNSNTACGTSVSNCAITLGQNLTIGNSVFVTASFPNNTTTINTSTLVTGGGGTWTQPNSSGITCALTTDATAGTLDCVYNLVVTTASGTLTVNFSAAVTGAKVWMAEYSVTAGHALIFDSVNGRDQSTAVTNPAGATLTFCCGTAFSELQIQSITSAGTVSAVSGSYTNPADFSGIQGNAGLINVTASSQPTWTTTSARAIAVTMSFREVAISSAPALLNTVPRYVQAVTGNQLQSVTFQWPVKSGHEIVVIESDQGAASPGSDPSFTDSLGTTYTKRATGGNGAGCSSGGIRIYTGPLTASGVNTVTASAHPTQQYITAIEFENVADATDGTAVTTWSSQSTVTSGSITPTQNGDVMIFGMHNCTTGRQQVFPVAPMEYLGTGDNGDVTANGYYIANDTASHNATFTENGTATDGSTVGLALKAVSALTVQTNYLPDAISGSAYTANLVAAGGSGSYTWSVSAGALPCGLSISGSTITGTPTCSNGGSVTLQVADGASHTATKAYAANVHVGTSLSTPALLQSNTGVCQSAGSAISIGTVTSGSVLVITGVQNPNTNGVGPSITDYLGNYFTPLYGSASQLRTTASNGAETLTHWIGFATTGGADKLECNGSKPTVIVQEFSNLAAAVDFAVFSTPLSSSGGSSPITSNALVMPTAGTVVGGFMPVTSTTTITAGSGATLTTTATNSDLKVGGEFKNSVAKGSATLPIQQSGNTDGHSKFTIYGFIPTTTGTAPTASAGLRHGVFF